jgi:cytochrome c-type biogenesis protein CcmF
MRIHIKPFIRWIWGGALLMLIGGMISASDRRYWVRRRADAEAEEESRTRATDGRGDEALAT